MEVRGRGVRYVVSVGDPPRTLEVDLVDDQGEFMSLLVEGRSYEVGLQRCSGGYRVLLNGESWDVELTSAAAVSATSRKGGGGVVKVVAPMPGKLVRVLVEPGQQVQAGEGLVVIEAMKMENELRAPRAGRIKELHVRERQAVESGALLVVVE